MFNLFTKKLSYEQRTLLEKQYYTYLMLANQNGVVVDCYMKQAYRCYKKLKDHGIVLQRNK